MTFDDAFIAIVAGTISSLLAVLCVELARALRPHLEHRALRRVLGLHSPRCIISAAAIHDSRRSWAVVGQREAHAFAYVGSLVLSLGAETEIVASQDPPGSQGRVDEFCIGGPLTNQRTAEVLRQFIPDFEVCLTENARTTKDPAKSWVAGFRVGKERWPVDAEFGFAFLAKVHTDFDTTMHLVFGMTDLGVAAAAYYLHSQYTELARQFGTNEYFVLLRYTEVLGYKSVTSLRDCSASIRHANREPRILRPSASG